MNGWPGLYDIPAANDGLSVLLKVAGEACNIDCHYCYEKRKPRTSGKFLEAPEVRRFLLRLRNHPLAIELHGGEPLLAGRERIGAILDVLREHPAPVSVRIMTNAIHLDEDWLRFLSDRELPVQIGISLDGGPDHNAYRLDFAGLQTSSHVERALCSAHDHEIPVGVLCVVHRRNAHDPRGVLRHFGQFPAIKTVKFAPCFDYGVSQHRSVRRSNLTRSLLPVIGAPDWSVSPEEFADFLKSAFDYWAFEGLISRFLLEPHVSLLRSLHGQIPRDCHTSTRKCSHIVTLYPGGRVTSCDELPASLSLYFESAAEAGTIDDRPQLERPARSLADAIEDLLGPCTTCDYRDVCRGGCVAARLRLDSVGRAEEYCRYRISVIEHLRAAVASAGPSPQTQEQLADVRANSP